jgi:hypothetical protein
MPYKVGNFTLGRLDAPLLRELIGRAPYCKFTEVYPDSRQTPTKFPLIADAYLADIDDIDRKKIGQSLTNIVAKKFRATLPVEQITQSMPDTSAEEEFNQTRTAAVSVKDENFEIQESGDNESLFPEDFSVGKISQEITDTFAEVGKWCSQHKASIATVIIVVVMFIVLFVSLDKIAREGGLQMGSEYVKTLKMFNPKKFNKKKKQQP